MAEKELGGLRGRIMRIKSLCKRLCGHAKSILLNYHVQDDPSPLDYGAIDCSMYLIDIKRALDLIDTKYTEMAYISTDGEQSMKMYERMFAYEFYHKLRCIIECEGQQRYMGLHLNGEPDKSLSTYSTIAGIIDNDMVKGLNCIVHKKIVRPEQQKENGEMKQERESYKFIPDIILHHPGDLSRQIYMLEIKLHNNNQAISDLEKLSKFKFIFEVLHKKQNPEKGDSRFKYYIFIYVGYDLDDLIKKELEKSNNEGQIFEKIFRWSLDTICFHRNDVGKYEYESLQDILCRIGYGEFVKDILGRSYYEINVIKADLWSRQE